MGNIPNPDSSKPYENKFATHMLEGAPNLDTLRRLIVSTFSIR